MRSLAERRLRWKALKCIRLLKKTRRLAERAENLMNKYEVLSKSLTMDIIATRMHLCQEHSEPEKEENEENEENLVTPGKWDDVKILEPWRVKP